MSTAVKLFKVLALLVLIVLIIIFAPLAIIWALNTLFPVVGVPYTFFTWLAVIVLNLTWFSKLSLNSNKE